MNEIHITKDYRISTDNYCWKVEKFEGVRKTGKKTGEDCWKAKTYHGTFTQATASLRERLLREGSAKSVTELLEHAKVVSDTISQALERNPMKEIDNG